MEGFANEWKADLPWRKIWVRVLRVVGVEDEGQRESYERDEEQEECKEELLHNCSWFF